MLIAGWTSNRRWYAIVGATLFFISDLQVRLALASVSHLSPLIVLDLRVQLAWNKFIGPLRYSQLRVMTTYHIGQFCLALSLIK